MTATRRSFLAGAMVAASGGPLVACASYTAGTGQPALTEAHRRAGFVPRGMGRVWIFGPDIHPRLDASVLLGGREVYRPPFLPAGATATLNSKGFADFRDVPPGDHHVSTSIRNRGGPAGPLFTSSLSFTVAAGEERFVKFHAQDLGVYTPMTMYSGRTMYTQMVKIGDDWRLIAVLAGPEARGVAAATKVVDQPSRFPDPVRR